MTNRITQKITPFLWFDDKAEEAAKFYCSIFENSRVGDITRYDEEAAKPTGRPAGSVMVVEFQLEGQEFVAPEQVQELAVSVLAHRVVLDPQARFGGASAATLIGELLRDTKVPA